ncbi:hypothetical protein COT20_01020 [bacterium (Candidatus Gribaldobacteria) CG08_land_8_20_14_0_20_39_15]|uniref:Uncharacterized protein n=1 Tax=bacterium (Candidatus Gribaldobacteria) CG08_land_8_20_14_0_20_39_15 TaxID=2014273 RepID=A0A2M6XUU9_9BACT|nr:MAG: hypothetical protein COT20_01020 [bacterium (Candidatus Gribaldobacteria) CG08_land_8_20_14_0_20_39_15]
MVDIKKWQQFSLTQQMANIGSEVSRMIAAKERGDALNLQQSTERALEILDLTINSNQKKSCFRELLRLRDVLADYGFNLFNFVVDKRDLNEYFLPFALLSRR